ncbi:MAG: hypothetical protein V1800_08745 [Candidatus Latescibacterota bacterium]
MKKLLWIGGAMAICVFGGCDLFTQSENENRKPMGKADEFAVCFPAQGISTVHMSESDLNDPELEEEPILSVEDIIS